MSNEMTRIGFNFTEDEVIQLERCQELLGVNKRAEVFRQLMKLALGESKIFKYEELRRKDGEDMNEANKTRYRNMLHQLKAKSFIVSQKMLVEEDEEEIEELKQKMKNIKSTLSLIKEVRKEDEVLNDIINNYDILKLEKAKLEFQFKDRELQLKEIALEHNINLDQVKMLNG